MKLGVLLVHGIGTEHPEWAAEIIPTVEGAILSEVRELLPDHPPLAPEDLAAIESVYWAGELNERQQILEQRLRQGQQKPRFSFWRWFRGKEVEFVSRSVADIIGYFDPAVERSVHGQMEQALERLIGRTGADGAKMPLTILSHSLGTVISSNYVYDRRKGRGGKAGFHEKAVLENLFTVGSPLALFSLKYGGPDAFQSPIRMEGPRGRWVNIRDVNDPIGMPLKNLNEAYGRVVLKEAQVHAGFYLVSHQRYFQNRETLRIIGRKLALDWAALNGKLPPERAERLYAQYDEKLR